MRRQDPRAEEKKHNNFGSGFQRSPQSSSEVEPENDGARIEWICHHDERRKDKTHERSQKPDRGSEKKRIHLKYDDGKRERSGRSQMCGWMFDYR